jgi:outer membrane protein assembly factor BamB
VLWQRQLGSIQSRNNIVSANGHILVSTSGKHWNKRDKGDGVARIDPSSGRARWFTPTTSDVNELALAGRHVLAPTDAGDIFILNIANGDIDDVHRLDAPALARPLVWAVGDHWEAVAISAMGTVYRFGSGSDYLEKIGDLGGRVRASPIDTSVGGNRRFVAFLEDGRIVQCELNRRPIFTPLLTEVSYLGYGANLNTRDRQHAFLYAAPAVEDGLIYLGYARNTYYDSPPVICVDINSGEIRWEGISVPGRDFGNCRTTPVVFENILVCAFAYTDGLTLLDKETGRFLDNVTLGQNVFQQWSSPILVSDGLVVVGRVDGVVSVVDLRLRKLLASISLATPEAERRTFNSRAPSQQNNYGLYPGEPPMGGICGTPTVRDGIVYAGTTAGTLVAISLGRRPLD